MDTLHNRRELLDPARYDVFAWKLFSHKICRWALPVSVIPGVIGLAILSHTHSWAQIILIAGGLVAVLALAGALWPAGRAMPRLLSLAAFGIAANLAVLHAIWRMLAGHRDHVWEPTRRSA
jgi:phosphoglycerol transferase MdoB-like AlkP superfamily enzyme